LKLVFEAFHEIPGLSERLSRGMPHKNNLPKERSKADNIDDDYHERLNDNGDTRQQ
jgi:hypothetical protein